MGKVTRQCPLTRMFEYEREPRRIKPRSFCLPAYRLIARPHRLTVFKRWAIPFIRGLPGKVRWIISLPAPFFLKVEINLCAPIPTWPSVHETSLLSPSYIPAPNNFTAHFTRQIQSPSTIFTIGFLRQIHCFGTNPTHPPPKKNVTSLTVKISW